jgi:hypothetical protein
MNKNKVYRPEWRMRSILLLIPVFMLNFNVKAQDRINLEGRILSGPDKGIPGVIISIEGSDNHAVSDSLGFFAINCPSGLEWLLIKPVRDYKEQRIFLNNRSKISIYPNSIDIPSIYENVNGLNGTYPKKDLVSAVTDINKSEYYKYTSPSSDQYFQQNFTGIYFMNHSGMPGSGGTSLLRGLRSLFTNSQPLVLIDGIPLETSTVFNSGLDGFSYIPLSNIDPIDISRMTIYKDAVNASSFGTRSSNGIISIETLEPDVVQTQINLIVKTGFSSFDNRLPQLNSIEYKAYANELLNTSGMNEEDIINAYPGLFTRPGEQQYYLYQHNTNWQNEIFDKAVMNSLNLNVKGGDAIGKYGLSFGYTDYEGVIKNTNYNRFNTRFVGKFSVFSWLNIDLRAYISNSNSQLKESARVDQTSPVLTALYKTPLLSPNAYDEDGKKLIGLADMEELGISNPSVVIKNFNARNQAFRINTSYKLSADINKGLNFNSLLSYAVVSLNEDIFRPNKGMELYYDGEA